MGKRDYYETLGVGRDATEKEIKRAYRGLARKYHPDVNCTDSDTEEKFKEINEAYEMLSDADKRYRYDNFGHANAGASPGDFNVFNDLFGMVFGDFGAQSRTRPMQERGSDLICEIAIELEEVLSETEKFVDFRKAVECDKCGGTGAEPGTNLINCPSCGGSGFVRSTQRTVFGNMVKTHTCSKCNGRGKIITSMCKTCGGEGRIKKVCRVSVKVPAGIPSGSRLKVKGQGEAGFRGGPAGDLYVDVYVKPHSFFGLNGNDVICDFAINFGQAALGMTAEIPTLDGTEKLKIPAGVQSETMFTLRGKGLPYLNSRRRGNQLVRIRVTTPTKLSTAQRELFERLAEGNGESIGIRKRIIS